MTPVAAQPAGRRERLAGLVVAIATVTVAAFALGLTMPMLAVLMEADGRTGVEIGISSAMAPLSILLFSPFVPGAVARMGAKRFVLRCVLLCCVAMLSLKLFENYWAWLPIRLLMGMAIAGLFVASESWIGQVADNTNRGRIMAIYNMVLTGGFASGPLVLGLVGGEGWAPFLLGAGLLAAAALPLVLVPVNAPSFEGTPSFGVLGYVRVAPTLAFAVLAYAMLENGGGSLIAVYGLRHGLPEPDALMLLSLVVFGGMICAYPVGWLGDRFHKMTILAIMAGIGVLGGLLMPFTMHDEYARMAVMLVWGGAATSLYALALAIQGERFSGAELVTGNAAFGVLYGLGALIGPLVAGTGMDLADPDGFAWSMALFCGVFLAFLLVRQLSKWRRSRGGQPRTDLT
ncbi:MAG: MFS transporter [Pseudomonadota bacterium]|nr:MFS transporter [Pseudomonadota bacterium]